MIVAVTSSENYTTVGLTNHAIKPTKGKGQAPMSKILMFISALLCVLLTLTFLGSNFVIDDFSGFNGQQFPVPQPDPPLVPPLYAFIIWAPIYLWLLAGMTWGLVNRSTNPEWHSMRTPLILSLAIATFWLPVAQTAPVVASIMICAMLIFALLALSKAPNSDRIFAAWPIGLYAGWLSAATCVSLSVLTAGYGILSEISAALVFAGVAGLLAFTVQWRTQNAPTYGIAVIWALASIAIDSYGQLNLLTAASATTAFVMLIPTIQSARLNSKYAI